MTNHPQKRKNILELAKIRKSNGSISLRLSLHISGSDLGAPWGYGGVAWSLEALVEPRDRSCTQRSREPETSYRLV